MRMRGGYDVRLAGRPSREVDVLDDPHQLHIPLHSKRFDFTELLVEAGAHVRPGQTLARDPDNYSVPLLAPRGGTVRLDVHEHHITIDDVTKEPEEPYHPDEDSAHVPKGSDSSGMTRYKLLSLGAWQFMRDAHTDALPDPFGTPKAVVVSTVSTEPYVTRGDVQLRKRLALFTRGLEHLQSLVEYQPIYLVVPAVRSDLAREVRERLRGYAWVNVIEVPLRYPFDNFRLLARRLGLAHEEDHPVWAIGTGGVLAIDRALTLSRSSTVRIVSIGGPAVTSPRHLKVVSGFPLEEIRKSCAAEGPVRIIDGGLLTGRMTGDARGLDAECEGLTVLNEHTEREFLGFLRPGWGRRSYSRCFVSAMRPAFSERLTTALRGESRACLSCGFCEEVCPASIMPHLIHKLLYCDDIEEVERARVDLCIGCGLCSYVCPSKIELAESIAEAKRTIRRELASQEAQK